MNCHRGWLCTVIIWERELEGPVSLLHSSAYKSGGGRVIKFATGMEFHTICILVLKASPPNGCSIKWWFKSLTQPKKNKHQWFSPTALQLQYSLAKVIRMHIWKSKWNDAEQHIYIYKLVLTRTFEGGKQIKKWLPCNRWPEQRPDKLYH